MNHWGIDEFWMPVVTGGLFFVPLLLCSFLLQRVPPPTPEDVQNRTERMPMTKTDRAALVKQFFFPLLLVILFYTFLTAFRDFRDNFARELWDSIGYRSDVSVFSSSEIIIAIVVLLIIGSIFYIKDSFKALLTYHWLLLLGIVVLAVSTVLFQTGELDPFVWMVATGFGLYICYVPFNCVLVLLYKNFGQAKVSWLNFFVYGTYAVALIGLVVTVALFFHFGGRHRTEKLNKQLDYGK
jgi:hypothetical protein